MAKQMQISMAIYQIDEEATKDAVEKKNKRITESTLNVQKGLLTVLAPDTKS
jgi:uncharacterized membrane protein YsdA (DUF1294 family)